MEEIIEAKIKEMAQDLPHEFLVECLLLFAKVDQQGMVNLQNKTTDNNQKFFLSELMLLLVMRIRKTWAP